MIIVKERSLNKIQLQDIESLFKRSNRRDNTNYVFDENVDFKDGKEINTFLLYENKKLITAISIFAPKKTEVELIAITDPEYRKRGYFKRLLSEVVSEIKRRKTNSILFVCDYNFTEGSSAMDSMICNYEYSEYLMTYTGNKKSKIINSSKIKLIEAVKSDIDELIVINKRAFPGDEEDASGFMEENFQNTRRKLFSIFFEDKIAGMIGIYSETERHYIYGFCIDSKYRGKGYGKQSLNSIIDICRQNSCNKEICLEVQTDNENALSLYIDSGFEKVTEFKYYRKNISAF